MEITLSKLLGTGGACDVYDLENGKVIKLYFEGYSRASVEWEFKKTLDAYQKGLSAPQVYEIVEYHNRFGLIMEKLEGQTVTEIMFSYIARNSNVPFENVFNAPEVLGNIKAMAQMLHKLHRVKASLMDSVESTLCRSLQNNEYLADGEKELIRKKIALLPNHGIVCHGDPNPGNIIKNNQDYRWIDWVNTATGHPFYDLTYFVLMIKYLHFAPGTHAAIVNFVHKYGNKIIDAFLSEYKLLTGMDLSPMHDWEIPICVERLNATAVNENTKLLILQDIRNELQRPL